MIATFSNEYRLKFFTNCFDHLFKKIKSQIFLTIFRKNQPILNSIFNFKFFFYSLSNENQESDNKKMEKHRKTVRAYRLVPPWKEFDEIVI